MVGIVNNVPLLKYNTVAASATTQKLSAVNAGTTGASGDYLDSFTVIPATATPGAVTLFDGTTAIYSIPAGTTLQTYNIPLRAYSKTGAWNFTTGASVSIVAAGQFT
jgi:hypothetical protein